MRRVDGFLIAAGVIATVALGFAFATGAVDPQLVVALSMLALAVLAVAGLVARIAAALPARRPARRALPSRGPEPVVQLVSLARTLELAEASSFDLHNRLRPIVREIATARLARRGVSLDRQPERARTILGPHTWELVRADREQPVGRSAPGWSTAELREVVETLEAI